MFTNPDFQVDKTSEEYLLLNPVISQLSKSKAKKLKAKEAEKEIKERIEIEDAENEHYDNSSDESFIHDDSSSEDEKLWVKEVKNQYRLIKKNEKRIQENNDEHIENEPQLYEIKENVEFKDAKPVVKKQNKTTLGERLKNYETDDIKISASRGNKEITFISGKNKQTGRRKLHVERHGEGYKHLLRPAGILKRMKR